MVATVDREVLYLHSPVCVGEKWQGEWFDAAHEHTIVHSEGYFYVIAHDDENPTPRLYFHKSDLSETVILAKMSLSRELLAIQLSYTSLLVVDVSSRKIWIVEVKNPVDSVILPGGIIWSDHGGSSQDLVLVTNKGLELFKITAKRAQCKLSRVISQPAAAFWYNPHHRMIMVASFNRVSSVRSLKSPRDVLLMDTFFLKTERSALPTLELPPPDRAPRFEIGPGMGTENVHLISVYGHALALTHYCSGGEDLVTVYLLTKTSVDRVHSLSLSALGLIPPSALRVSTLDNLVLFHSSVTKQSLVFDLMTSVRSKQSVASIAQLEPLGPPCPVCANEEIVRSSTTSLDPSAAGCGGGCVEEEEEEEEDWQAVAAVPLPSDLRDFASLRFAEPAGAACRVPRRSMSTSSALRLRTVRLKAPQPVDAFYVHSALDLLGRFVYDKEARVMWRLSCNLLSAAAGSRSPKERVRFLSRRGRVYDFAGRAAASSAQTKVAKHALLKVLLDALQGGAGEKSVHDYLEALLGPYISEHRRLMQVDELGAGEGEQLAQSKALQAMDLAQSPARLGGSVPPPARRASLTDMLTSRLAASRGARAIESTGVLELVSDRARDQLEPFGLSSALFSDITSLGMKAKSWAAARSRTATLSTDLDPNRTRSRSLKPVNDCALIQLRRDGRGDLIATQTELVTLVWVPFLLRCRASELLVWARVLTEYMARLAEEDIARTPALSALHLSLLFNTQQYASILGNLRMHLYSDTVEVAFMLLQFADLLAELPAAQRPPQATLLAKTGTDMLWRLNEKIAVVKYLLSKGRVSEAIDICRSYGGIDPELSSRYISGIEFFSAAARFIGERPSRAEPSAAGASAGDEDEDEALMLYNVYVFLVNWDGAILGKSTTTSRSRLANAATFPVNSMSEGAAAELRALFGFL